VFVHSCLGTAKMTASYAMPIKEWCPAVYVVRYVDGRTAYVHTRYGMDIGNIHMDFGRRLNHWGWGETFMDRKALEGLPKKCLDPPVYMPNATWKNSLMYSASPFFFGDCCAYIQEWENNRPNVAVDRVYAVNTVKKKEEQVLLFCVAAVIDFTHALVYNCTKKRGGLPWLQI